MEIKKLMNPFYLYNKRNRIIPYLRYQLAYDGKYTAMKVLSILGLKPCLEEIVESWEAERIRKEQDMFSREPELRPLNFRHYLPDTEKRIERLRRLIDGRPVAIILHGPSVTELEERITELEDCDICYFGLNNFRVPEQHILQKINRNLSVLMCSDPVDLRAQMNNHNVIDFLERREDSIFISERDSFRLLTGFDLDKFIERYDKKLLFFADIHTSSITIRDGIFPQIPSIEYPLHFPRQSSFSILLSLAVIGGTSKVVIFGGDGGRIGGRELYFKDSSSFEGSSPDSVLEWILMQDTRMFNVTMPLMLEKIYKMYNLRPVDIVNCSVHSHYTPLRKLPYDETFTLLKSFKKGGEQ